MAGRSATAFGDLGAEVIKSSPVAIRTVEDGSEGHLSRGIPGDHPESSGMINDRNRNKMGSPGALLAGERDLQRLVKISDAVVENFQAGVMSKLGMSLRS